MDLQQELRLRAANISRDDLLHLLGYRRLTPKHRQRLFSVLNEPWLGLRRSAFDFRYGDHAFILALADVLGINVQLAKTQLQVIRSDLYALESEFVPYIWVDTGFKRTTQPIFALAFCEPQRTIRLNEQDLALYRKMNMPQRVQLISRTVKAHHQMHQDRLGIWGVIQRYVYHYEQSRALILLPNGEVLEDAERGPAVAQATVRQRGKSVELGG